MVAPAWDFDPGSRNQGFDEGFFFRDAEGRGLSIG